MALQNSEIDPKFSAHSFQAASTSKAMSASVSLKNILNAAQWSKESTFYKLYCKDIVTSGTSDISLYMPQFLCNGCDVTTTMGHFHGINHLSHEYIHLNSADMKLPMHSRGIND